MLLKITHRMSCKRSYTDQDPDYENDLSNDQKRLKVIEKDNKDATVRKIQQIITSQFNQEVKLKEAEAKEINERLYQTLKMLDQLRVSVISSYYSFDKPSETTIIHPTEYQPPIHPCVKKYIGKRPKQSSTPSVPPERTSASVASKNSTLITPNYMKSFANKEQVECAKAVSVSLPIPHPSVPPPPPATVRPPDDDDFGRSSRFKIRKRVVVGNVSKYIPVDKREERDQSTHKWMVYVRGPKEEPFIETFVKKVWFFLHPSYRPNDLVEINHPPFHLTRRGWGEFPVRIQLHFHNSKNKRVDIIHTLKLDTTYTGLQTLGSETVVDVLILKPNLPLFEVTEKIDHKEVSGDIGGIAIPAEVKESPNKASKIHQNGVNFKLDVPESSDVVAKLILGEELAKEIASIPPRNNVAAFVKEELVEKSDKLCSEKFLNSFMNDHGAYFNPVVAESMRSECENSSLVTANHNLLTSTSTVTEPIVKIKQEPRDDDVNNDEDLPNGFLQFNSSFTSIKKECAQDVDHYSVLDRPVLPNQFKTPLKAGVDQKNNTIWPASGRNLVNDDLVRSKSPIETKMPPCVGNQVMKFPLNSTSRINNLPVLVIPQKSQISTNSSSATVANISIKTPLPTNTSQQSTPIVAGELAKSDTGSPSQTSNGVATFVKCVDKLGNLYLIPLAMFLKMNPSAQTNILQSPNNAASSMPSLLKPLPAPSTVTGPTTNTTLSTSRPKVPSPSVVSFPAARNTSSSVQQSLLFNSKTVNTAPANHLNRSLLLPQNSVSLLAGTPPRSKLSSSTTGVSSSAKTMVSCLVKNRITGNTKAQSSSVTKEIPSLNLDLFESMDGIVRHLTKIYPLVAPNPDRAVHPYCAASLKDFFHWNVGKRHAAEWQRARAIRSKILSHTSNSVKWKSGDVWSVKRLLLWCRHYGYSPIKIVEHQGDNYEVSEAVEINSVQFATYTEATQLLDSLKKESENLKERLVEPEKDDEEEEEIDVVVIEDKLKLKAMISPAKAINDSVVSLSSTPTGEFVREIVEQIGLKLLPEEVCKDTLAPLAEEVLLSAVKQFAEEILSSANASSFQIKGNRRLPSIITAQHVGNAIREHPHCDFLTNCYLGSRIPKSHIDIMGSVKL